MWTDCIILSNNVFMDLNLITLYLTLVEAGSFTKAAKILKQPKSTVSRRVAVLERELGVTLLYRTTRQVQITPAGLEFYESCRHQVLGLQKAVENAKGATEEIQGTLRITAVEDIVSSLFAPILIEVKKKYPKLVIEVNTSQHLVDLVRDGFDLALRIGNLKDSSLMRRSLGQFSSSLFASPAYLKKSHPVKKLSDLRDHKAIGFQASGENVWILKNGKKEEVIEIFPSFTTNTPKLALELALTGHGVVLLPEWLCQDALKSGKLIRILENYKTAPTDVQFVWPAHREQNKKMRAFIDIAANKLTKYFPANTSSPL